MSKLSLNVPKPLEVKLRAEAKRRRATRAKVALEALEKQFHVKKAQGKVSIADLISDLAGCYDGPSDLSTNKKYMEGYGR